MIINYDDAELQSKTVWFFGETDGGKEFTIMANWNEWDDWNVTPDEISFNEDDGTDEEREQIIEQFLTEINS